MSSDDADFESSQSMPIPEPVSDMEISRNNCGYSSQEHASIDQHYEFRAE